MSQVTLISQDGLSFSVEKIVAERSLLLKNMLDDVGDEDSPIPLPNVTGNILQKIIDYCTHHKSDPPTPSDDDRENFESSTRKRSDDIDLWDSEFIKVNNDELFEIILAANYLDIKALLDLGCKTVANMIKGKSPEAIREMFNIENDFTPEEEEQIKRENEWAADA
ncbi:hypothetical protein HK098_005000 [Nowakowskiella sp. JEL0407]|nr:hypothetical protein HK098_005000 [Nowakowskiella sp. JEL0407]